LAGFGFKQWIGIGCVWATILCLSLVHQPISMENLDGCDLSCPCDQPPSDLVPPVAGSFSISAGSSCSKGDTCNLQQEQCSGIQELASAEDENISASGSSEEPCPRDCPDCGCQASQVTAGLADAFCQLPGKLSDRLYCDWISLTAKGEFDTIFHPPRISLA